MTQLAQQVVETQEPAPLTMKSLLEAGVHFGHQKRRWNPRMREYIFTHRNGIHIIDLQKTLRMLEEACEFISDTVAQGKKVLLVGTKKQGARHDPARGRALRRLLHQQPMAWGHAHQLQDDSVSHRLPGGVGDEAEQQRV